MNNDVRTRNHPATASRALVGRRRIEMHPTIRAVFLLLLALALAGAGWAQPGITPDGDDAMLVLMANGIYNASQLPPVSVSGDYFDSVIMGRDAIAKDLRRQDALGFFHDRYGVDFLLIPPSPVGDGDLIGVALDPSSPTGFNNGVLLVHSYMDQRWGYKAYVISGENISSQGRTVHEGRYSMLIVDPAGVTMFGSWGGAAGTLAPGGSRMVHGEYLIEHPGPNRDKDIHLTLESNEPISDVFDAEGFVFNCTVHSVRWGTGAALGRQFVRQVGLSSNVQAVIRNVISFPTPPSLE